MRVFNLIMITGTKSGDSSSNLISSGVNGTGVISALKIQPDSPLRSFTSHQGQDDEDPYGNVNMYNSGTIKSASELAVTQSFSTVVTGSASTDFIFLLESKHRG